MIIGLGRGFPKVRGLVLLRKQEINLGGTQ